MSRLLPPILFPRSSSPAFKKSASVFKLSFTNPCSVLWAIEGPLSFKALGKPISLAAFIASSRSLATLHLETGIPAFSTIRRDSDSEAVVIINLSYL